MRRFRNILAVTRGERGDRPTLRRAIALARKNDAKLTVAVPMGPLPRVGLVDVEGMARDQATEEVERMLRRLSPKTFRAHVVAVAGPPAESLITAVEEGEHDLLMKPVDESGGLFRSNLDRQLLRACPCPVWLVKPTRRRRYHRVLAAVDPMHVDPDHRDLDHTVMQLASSLAADEHSELHVVHAWSVEGEGALVGAFGPLSAAELELLHTDRQREISRRVAGLVGRYASDEARRVVLHVEPGRAEDLLPEIVRKQHIDVVVMGTMARRGVAGFVIGNTAEKVLRNIDCSVLTAKRPGFEQKVRRTG